MTRASWIVGACLGVFLILLPLGLEKPGLPMNLRADEPTYLAMAASLGLDGDLQCEAKDVERVFLQFPYGRAPKLHLAFSDDPQGPPTFDRPPLFAWIAALPVRLFGANGLLALNGLLFFAILAMATYRRGPDNRLHGPGGLFAAVFLFASAVFPQAYWLDPTLFYAFLATFALWSLEAAAAPRARRPGALAAASGAALGAATAVLPGLLLLAPGCLLNRRRGPWLTGWLLGVALALGSGWILGITPFDAELESRELTVTSPYADLRAEPEPRPTLGESSTPAAFQGVRSVFFSLVERRTGFLPYFPVALVLIAWVAGRRRRPLEASWLTATAAGIALYVLAQPWLKGSEVGGEAFGNPALVVVYPALLFLIRRPPPAAVPLAGAALGVLTLGPALVSNLGSPVAYSGLQAHTRAAVLSKLPLDPSNVGSAGDYILMPAGGPPESEATLWVPSAYSEIRGEEAWLLGNSSPLLFLESRAPLEDAVFQIRNLTPNNRIAATFGGDHQVLHFEEVPPEGAVTRLSFRPEGLKRHRDGRDLWVYPLKIDNERGRKPFWNNTFGNVRSSQRFYLGSAIAFLGPQAFLELEVYGAEFLTCEAPESVAAGDDLLALTRVRNTSSETWPVTGAAQVRIGYRWLDASGKPVLEGERTHLENTVAPGETATTWVAIKAPRRPGTYQLELDPIFENVAWFSSKGVDTCRRSVGVEPADPDDEERNSE